jgi:superfamily II DNA or RNA helicase
MEQLKLKEEPKLYAFQEECKNRLITCLAMTNKIPVLAMATGSGKTETTIYAIKELLQENPALKFAILTHGQVVLRSQFYTRIECLRFPEIRECEVAPGIALNRNANVFVGLPVNFKNIKDLKVDYVITDEAHERVGSKEHTQVVKSLGKPRQIFLTASHGDLDQELNMQKITFSSSEALKAGVVSNFAPVGISTSWKFTEEDYNSDNHLKADTKISTKDILGACEDLVKNMEVYHQKSAIGRVIVKTKNWLFDDFPKTVIACHSIKMADQVARYFRETKIGDKVVISHSQLSEDYDIRNFEASNNKLLIVVDRAKIGFDAPSIRCLVDMTGTKNVGLVMQLMGRVMRKHPNPNYTQKTYFKVLPQDMENHGVYLLTAAMVLAEKGHYAAWNGISIEKLVKMPVRRPGTGGGKKGEGKGGKSPIPDPGYVPPTLREIAEHGMDWFTHVARTRNLPIQEYMYMTLDGVGKIGSSYQTEYNKELIKKWDKRPNMESEDLEEKRLGSALTTYISKKSRSYDSQFDSEIRLLHPDWFVDTAAINKEFIKKLNEKPSRTSNNPTMRKLAGVLHNYIYLSGECYDPEFDKEIRILKPDWFVDTAAINKDLIKKLDQRPSGNSKNMEEKRLGGALCRYTGKTSYCYDPEFDKEIRRLKPDWFIDVAAVNKELIMKLDKRPNKNGKDPEEVRLGHRLSEYISKKCGSYDPEFDKEIRRLKPDWFLDTVMINKQFIRKLNKRPSQSSKDPEEKRLGVLLSSYIRRTHRSYDPIFDADIRKLKPDWFK